MENERKSNGKKKAFLILLLVLLLGVTVGFATLGSTLQINGTSTIKSSTWNIGGDDTNPIECPSGEVCTINPQNPGSLTPDDGEVTPENPNPNGAIIWMDGNTVYFKHLLSVPGDVFTFNVTYTNNGTVDAKVASVNKSQLNSTAQQYLTYTATYSNGNEVTVGDILAAGASVAFKVTVAYKSTVTELPDAETIALINETANGKTGATSSFTVEYEQA